MKRSLCAGIGARVAMVLALSLGVLASSVSGQGSLTPPGAPTPSMKTLDQVQPRIPISQPKPPATFPIVIDRGGSYYLTENIAVNPPNTATAIKITYPGVTLDLNGFTIVGNNGTAGTQIGIDSSTGTDAVIRNGHIFVCSSHGITAAANATIEDVNIQVCAGVGIQLGNEGRIQRCRITRCKGGGIAAGFHTIIDHCTVGDNGATGITTTAHATISDVVASNNAGGGIAVFFRSNVSRSIAANNAGTGIVCDGPVTDSNSEGNKSRGIQALSASHCYASGNASDGFQIFGSIVDCKAEGNGTGGSGGSGIVGGSPGLQVKDCTALSNKTAGINIPIGSTVTGCTVRDNGSDGILAANDSLLVRNTCTKNGGAGIHTTSAGNRIEENQLVFNAGPGLKVDAAFSLVIKNSARFNAPNYAIAASNSVGPVVFAPPSTAINGNTGGTGVGSTDPWANIAY